MHPLPADWSWSEYSDDDLRWFVKDHESALNFNPRQRRGRDGLTSADWIYHAMRELERRAAG